jgi:hypothetical protein
MPACGSGAIVSSLSLLSGGHPRRRQAETPLIPLRRFPEPALQKLADGYDRMAAFAERSEPEDLSRG